MSTLQKVFFVAKGKRFLTFYCYLCGVKDNFAPQS